MPLLSILTFLLALALLPHAAFAQNAPPPDTTSREVILEYADSLAGSIEAEARVNRLYNVRLRQGATYLRADRAVQYAARKEYLFSGNVLIIDEGDTLHAARVRYNSRDKVGDASGSVRLSDGEVEVFAPAGTYFVDEKRALFRDGVRLVDSTAVLTSRGGEYWSEEKRGVFVGEVVVQEERSRLEADTVEVFRETEESFARGNVFLERLGGDDDAPPDTTSRLWLFGQRVYNDNVASYSRVEGRPLLVQLDGDTTGAPPDTLVMRAVRLEASRSDSLERLVAVDSVHIWRGSFAAVADSLVFDRREAQADTTHDALRLFRSPVAWQERTQISGDTLRVVGRGGAVDSLFAFRQAFVAQADSATGRIQQLAGRRIVGIFQDDSLRTLRVGPNAEMIYFLKDDADAPDGAVHITGDVVVFYFRGGDVRRASVLGGTEGPYYPEGLIPEPLALDGLSWQPSRRPQRITLIGDTVLPDPSRPAWWRPASSQHPVGGPESAE